MPMKLPSAQKRVLWVLEKSIFCFFANFSLKKLKPPFGKVRQSIQSHLNQSLVIGMFVENGFEAMLSSKTSVVIVWKGHFLVFWRFLSDEVETIFWEIKRKRSKLFQWKFGHKKLLRKCLWSYLQLKNECCECLKRAFSVFLQIFHWRSWNHLLGRWGKAFKAI